jgi:hypothetical protein
MKLSKLVGLSSALALSAMSLVAQEANPAALSKQLEELLRVQKQQAEQIESLKKQIEVLKGQPAIPGAKVATPEMKLADLEERVIELDAELNRTRGKRFSASIGMVGDFVGGYTSAGNDKTGSSRPGGTDIQMRTMEISFEATVDKFARGYAVLTATDDGAGEGPVGVEELALVLTAPWDLTLRAGRFFADFGKLSSRHEAELPFVHRPLVLERFIGGESKTDGLELHYDLPIEQHVTLAVGAGNQFGEAQGVAGTFRGLNELNYWTRLNTTVPLGKDWSLELGVSGLIGDRAEGRNGAVVQPDASTLTERRRRVAGVDWLLRWAPEKRAQSFELGGEWLYSTGDFQFDPDGSLDPAGAAPGLTGDEFNGGLRSRGFYGYGAYGFDRRWTGGLMFDWVEAISNVSWEEHRLSPYLTYQPSDSQLWRLQYSRTQRGAASGLQNDHAVYLQWTFTLGRHSHIGHKH